MKSLKTAAVCLGTCLALLALPVLATDVVESGPDMWMTSGQTYSYASFVSDPIPAGFFCPGSKAFAGRIPMRGEPLATEPAGVLGHIDTIIHRLDNATFDEKGVATTRIRFLALSLASIEPFDVGCDRPFTLATTLDGEQPTTEMKIYREVENGGSYVAPLALEAKLVFTPVGSTGEPVVLHRRIDLGPGTNSVWATSNRGRILADGRPVKVDTDGDQIADTDLPRPSNFIAGVSPAAVSGTATPVIIRPICPVGTCPYTSCHCKPEDSIPPPEPDEPNDGCDDYLHCVHVCVPCGGPVLGDIGTVGTGSL